MLREVPFFSNSVLSVDSVPLWTEDIEVIELGVSV